MATRYVTLKDSNGDTIYPQAIVGGLDGRLYSNLAPCTPGATEIAANKNLNTTEFLKVGTYVCPTDATYNTLTNAAGGSAFCMEVMTPIDDAIDDEATATYVYRVRKITNRFGYTYVQAVSSGATPGSFTYGSWNRLVDSKQLSHDMLGANRGGYTGATSGLYCRLMRITITAPWKTVNTRFTFASTQSMTFAYDIICSVSRGSDSAGVNGVQFRATALYPTSHDLATRLKAVRIDANTVDIFWQTDSGGSGIANVYSFTTLAPQDGYGAVTMYTDSTVSTLPSGTQYSCTVKAYS